jgi:quercetin 2,3-dioxygenase
MKTMLYPAAGRGRKDIGWLKSKFTFSFSDYYNPIQSSLGTLVAFNDDLLESQKGFGLHPHVNMEIISVLLQGKMNHKDSMGYSTVFEAGAVQIMSAGSGLRHEEYNVGEQEVNFLQIWIEPKVQNISPRYQFRSFPKEKRKNVLTTIVSSEEGQSHCWINQNAKLSLGFFDPSQVIDYSFLPENKCLFIFLMEGSVKVEDVLLSPRDGLGVWDCSRVILRTGAESEFLLIETPVNQK